MQLSTLNIFLSDATAKAVCWTLVHSIWEGILAALVAGLIILCTRRLPVRLRYNLLAADLMLFLLAATATFFYERNASSPAHVVDTPQTAMLVLSPPTGYSASVQYAINKVDISTEPGIFSFIQKDWVRQANDYLNTHAILVTSIWLICLSAQLIRLMGGLYQVRRLRQKSIVPASRYWNDRLAVLAGRLGIKQKVLLLQSGSVKMPAVLGFIKPYILLPLGLLYNLPPDQVETILFHELAHIRRGDYLTNLLLHFAEAIFFFNPGVRWIGTLIRREREACCDDMVLNGTPDRNKYFEALIAFTQWSIDGRTAASLPFVQQIRPSFALQLGKGKNDLLWRIKRMLDKENKKLQIMEKAILSFGLLALVSVSLISMSSRPAPSVSLTASSPAAKVPTSTVPAASAFSPTSAAASTANPDILLAPATNTPGAKTPATVSTAASRSAASLSQPSLAVPGYTHGGTISAPSSATDTVPATDKPATGKSRIKKGNFAYMQCKSGSENGKKTFHMEAKDMEGNAFVFENTEGEESVFHVNGKLIPIEEYHNYPDFLENVGMLQHFNSPGVPAVVPDPPAATVLPPTPPVVAVSAPRIPSVPATARRSSSASVSADATPAGHVELTEVDEPVHATISLDVVPRVEPVLRITPDPTITGIIDDLMEMKLIDHTDPMSFSLDANEMTLNGKRQPAAIHEKFRSKFVKHTADHYLYSKNGSETHVTTYTSANGSNDGGKD